MTREFGSQSMVAPLKRVMVKRPDEAFGGADPAEWNYSAPIDLERARAEHDALVATLRSQGVDVVYHDAVQPGRADAIFTYDPALVTDRGALILSMGKTGRRGEGAAIASCLEALGIPTLATLTGDARCEGGDTVWLDEKTLAVGLGFRTNAAAVEQLREVLEPMGVEVIAYDLPYHSGPAACLHLGSYISLVADDLAIVYRPLMAVPFYRLLQARGVRFVDVPDEEFATLGPNALTLEPRKCLILDCNRVTRGRLEAAGCEVLTYRGDEISLKAEGGPTCLTRPLLRAM